MSTAETLAQSRDALASGDPQGAYRTLSSLFAASPDPLEDAGALKEALGLLAEMSRAFGAADLAELVVRAAATPDDPSTLYDAAYALYEQQQFAPATTLLWRANRIAPGSPKIVSELCGCLEKQLRYAEAALAVEASGVADRDPLCAYLSGYCWIMCGDLDVPRKRIVQLASSTDAALVFMRDALAAMLARADALTAAGVALDERALTAWQAVLSGSLLLHESPHGYDTPMHGRYAFVSDGPGLMREGIERLGRLLEATGRRPARVVTAPDRDSRVLGLATAKHLGLGCESWKGKAADDTLVVAWNLDTVGDGAFLKALHEHRPGQLLFAHASSWTDPFPYAPDVTTLLFQHATSAYTGGALRVDPATGGVTPAAPDPRTDGVLADEVLAAEITDASATPLEPVVAIAKALAALPEPQRPGFHRTTGRRIHQRAGGPVPSNRFA
ncbi:MAG: hypothetical protein KC619_14225 [Myxococcales bacterium]|nr:hypothetical protein [Myxococcales bacterium]